MHKRARAAVDVSGRPTSSGVSGGALMAAIVDSGFFSMVAIDLDGTILQWNRAAERLFGWNAAETVGRSIDLIVPADRRGELAALIAIASAR